ncbi:hypothetical protein [Agriterribacter sp.]|uniref:hypothetical protein n=1 Tax=Agriterribacter sp. TaxID=2821509 RepID=UPI002BEBEC12|nr:hypothetical protein [Agriterribacter sp.]HRP55549.1 hypothetical protein [Agriterribacter sp.]
MKPAVIYRKSNSAGTFPVIFMVILLCSAKAIYAQQVKNTRSIDSVVAAIDRHNWTKTDTTSREVSLEGGFAVRYYHNDQLQKIAATLYGETYREEKTYYLSGRTLLFVLEKTWRYNRPVTYDSASMKVNNDNEAFDPEKSTVLEQKNYFSNGHLFRRVDETGAVITTRLYAEEQRIIRDFKNNLLN